MRGWNNESILGFRWVLYLLPHCHLVLTQCFLVVHWETRLPWTGNSGENWVERGHVDLAGVLSATGVGEQSNHSAVLSVSKFKGYYCIVAFLVLPPSSHSQDMRNAFQCLPSPVSLVV